MQSEYNISTLSFYFVCDFNLVSDNFSNFPEMILGTSFLILITNSNINAD